MDSLIANDFNVELICKNNENESFFAIRRKDVWHFVKSLTSHNEEEGITQINTQITQKHIPRYLVAEAIDSLIDFNKIFRCEHTKNVPISTDESKEIGIFSCGKNSYDISLIKTKKGLPKEFCKLLEEDVEIYKLAKDKVKLKDGLYYLPRAKSYNKHQVASSSKRLIEAISFEREYKKRLDAHKFGIYSAFCTWRDYCFETEWREFCFETEEHRSMIEDLVDIQFEFNAEEIHFDPFLQVASAVQDQLLRKSIWGKGISISRDEAVEILAEGFGKLSTIQKAQFVLINGMHQGGLFLSLAQVLGLNPWESYIEWSTDGFQPDSPEEQALRTETAFIKMLGDLGGDFSNE